MPRRIVTLRLWEILLAFVAVTAAFVIGLTLVVHLGHQQAAANHARIMDIQRSRVISCRKTYHAFLDVFAPFFPPRAKRTQAQRRAWVKLERVVDAKSARCERQTKPKGAP